MPSGIEHHPGTRQQKARTLSTPIFPMNDVEKSTAPQELTLHFGRLLLVCLAAIILCGLLVLLMSDQFADCCDLSWLSRFVH
jgi:hypothetical protein